MAWREQEGLIPLLFSLMQNGKEITYFNKKLYVQNQSKETIYVPSNILK